MADGYQELLNGSISPEDLARTTFSLMGLDPDKRLVAPGDRPVRLVAGGRVVEELLAS